MNAAVLAMARTSFTRRLEVVGVEAGYRGLLEACFPAEYGKGAPVALTTLSASSRLPVIDADNVVGSGLGEGKGVARVGIGVGRGACAGSWGL